MARRAERGDRDRPPRRRALLPTVWTLAAVGASALSLWQLSLVWDLAEILPQTADDKEKAAGDSLDAALDLSRRGGEVASADLANAMFLAREAAKLEQGPRRRALLDHAIDEMMNATSGRPYWGESWTMLAYASNLRDGSAASLTRASFAQGYRASPYLVGSAPWRIAFGLSHWVQLDPVTQGAVIREAVWYSRRGGAERTAVLDRVRASPPDAYIGFMQVWLNSRIGDRDFAPVKGQTP